MKCPKCNIGALSLSFGLGLVISMILPDRFVAILISMIVVLLSYVFIKCCR